MHDGGPGMKPKDVQNLLQQLVQRSRLPQQVSLPVNRASGSAVAPANQASVLAAAPFSVTSVVAPVTTENVNITTSQPQPEKRRKPSYNYKVKVINPMKKSEVILHHLNGHTEKFKSVTEIRMKLIEEFRV